MNQKKGIKMSLTKESNELMVQDFFRFANNKLVDVYIEPTEEDEVFSIKVKDKSNDDLVFDKRFKIENKKAVDPKTNSPINELIGVSVYLYEIISKKAKYFT